MCVFLISPVPIAEPLTSELIDTPVFYNLAPRPIKYRVSVPIPNLSFENHISHVTKTAFFHIRNIDKLRNMLSVSDAEKLAHAIMTFRLEYCNALLGGCPTSSINKIQMQNAAARVLTRSRKYDHITPILQSLHWLPIKFRISYKIVLLAYKTLNGLAPVYQTNLLSCYNPTRSLKSQNSGL